MLRKLAILALLVLGGAAGVSFEARAQGTRKDDIVINARGFPQGGASVAICTQPAVTTTTPCSPLANVFSNPALTQALVNPLTTDGLGNYNFYAAPGKYTIQIYGPSITTKVIPDVVLPNDPATPTFTSVTSTSGITAISLTLSGNLTVSGSVSVTLGLSAATMTLTNQSTPPAAPSAGNTIVYTKTDKKPYFKDDTGAESAFATGSGAGNLVYASAQAGATADLKIQAAMNALPATGGTIVWDLLGAQTIATDVFNGVTKNIHHWVTSGQYTFSVSTNIPGALATSSNMTLQINRGAQLIAPTGVTVHISQPINAGNYQIFSTSGTGKFKLPGQAGTGYFDVTWWGAKEDTATDSTPAFLAAWTAAHDNQGGIVYAPETATIFGSQRYLLSTALTFPNVGSYPVEVWLAGPLRLGATLSVNSGTSIKGRPGNFTQVAAGGRHYGILIDATGANPSPWIQINGDSVRLENLALQFLSGGSVGIRADGMTKLTLSGISTDLTDTDLVAVGVQIRGGSTSFDIRIIECVFNGSSNPAGAKQLQFLSGGGGIAMPRQVEVLNTQFNKHGILIDTTGAGSGVNFYTFRDILYETFNDSMLTFNNVANVTVSGFIFDRINMADSATPAAILKVVGTSSTQFDSFDFILTPKDPLIDSPVVIRGVRVFSPANFPTFKAGTSVPDYHRTVFFGGYTGSAKEYGMPVNMQTFHVYWPLAVPSGLATSLLSGGLLVSGQQYFYSVTALDANGGETTMPATVNNTALTPNLTIRVTWTAVTGAASYNLYRSIANFTFDGRIMTTSAAVFKVNASPITATTFDDTALGTAGFLPSTYNTAGLIRLDNTGLISSALKINGETVSAAPRATYSAFLPGALGATWTAATLTLDKAITVTRVQVQAKTAPAGCTTNAVVRLSDGTTNRDVTIAAAANDSGAITQNYAAAAVLTLAVQTAAAGCTTSPADAMAVVEYRMQ